jgi:hypothetical protein
LGSEDDAPVQRYVASTDGASLALPSVNIGGLKRAQNSGDTLNNVTVNTNGGGYTSPSTESSFHIVPSDNQYRAPTGGVPMAAVGSNGPNNSSSYAVQTTTVTTTVENGAVAAGAPIVESSPVVKAKALYSCMYQYIRDTLFFLSENEKGFVMKTNLSFISLYFTFLSLQTKPRQRTPTKSASQKVTCWMFLTAKDAGGTSVKPYQMVSPSLVLLLATVSICGLFLCCYLSNIDILFLDLQLV